MSNESTIAMNEKYGEFASASGNVAFNESDVPEKLVTLIPYAKFWGLADDWAREQLATKAPEHVKTELKQMIARYDDVLDEWLAGDEAASANPSDAYVAFSAMRMCADFM
ncbi:MAG: hypothetical protein Q8M16_13795 [Pirellulaceae bacterium]|nr:hypothetical protein [Pirellulaceae bacterium]